MPVSYAYLTNDLIAAAIEHFNATYPGVPVEIEFTNNFSKSCPACAVWERPERPTPLQIHLNSKTPYEDLVDGLVNTLSFVSFWHPEQGLPHWDDYRRNTERLMRATQLARHLGKIVALSYHPHVGPEQ